MSNRSIISFDYAIKNQLRNKANYDIVSGFLSELFNKEVFIEEILESESNKANKVDKQNRVDILAKEHDGSKVIIELQFNKEVDYFQRMLYATSKVVTECLFESDKYEKIAKIYSVNIIYFNLGIGNDYIYHGTTSFEGIHSKDILQLSEDQQSRYLGRKFPSDLFPEYYIINLSSFNGETKDTLDDWVDYLKTDKVKDDTKAKGLARAKSILNYYQLSEEERRAYDYAVDQRRSLRSMFDTARDDGRHEGRLEGIAEGRAEGIAIGEASGINKLLTLLDSGLSLEEAKRKLGL